MILLLEIMIQAEDRKISLFQLIYISNWKENPK